MATIKCYNVVSINDHVGGVGYFPGDENGDKFWAVDLCIDSKHPLLVGFDTTDYIEITVDDIDALAAVRDSFQEIVDKLNKEIREEEKRNEVRS